MYYNEDGRLLSLSYKTWIRECVGNLNAFIITPKTEITDEEKRNGMISMLGYLIDDTYPDRIYVKYFPVVKNLGHYLFSNEVGIALRDVDPAHPLTREELETLLERIPEGNGLEIHDAKTFNASDMLCLLSIPLGFTWDIRSCF